MDRESPICVRVPAGLTRKLNDDTKQQLEEWPAGAEGMFVLEGKTAVIIGVAESAARSHSGRTIRMNVIGVDHPRRSGDATVQRVVPPDMLDSVCCPKRTWFFFLPCLFHIPRNRGDDGVAGVDLMKRGSYFIAMSRGKVYDQGR